MLKMKAEISENNKIKIDILEQGSRIWKFVACPKSLFCLLSEEQDLITFHISVYQEGRSYSVVTVVNCNNIQLSNFQNQTSNNRGSISSIMNDHLRWFERSAMTPL